MKSLKSLVALLGCVTLFSLSAGNASAQRGGNFDPAQFRQMRMDGYRESLEVTDDAEWKVLETAIGKVMDAQQDMVTGMARGMFGGRGGQRRGGNNGDTNNGGNQPRRNPFGGTPDPDSEALQAAIDAKAPAAELKAKMEKVRTSAKAKEAKYAAAQEDLKKLLSARQEAIAITVGLVR